MRAILTREFAWLTFLPISAIERKYTFESEKLFSNYNSISYWQLFASFIVSSCKEKKEHKKWACAFRFE